MNKSKISFYFVFIAFFTFLSIFLTIVQASYSNLTKPSKQVEADKYLEPLNPVLDSEIIQDIEKRQNLSENDEVIINSNLGSEDPVDTFTDKNTQPVLIKEENN